MKSSVPSLIIGFVLVAISAWYLFSKSAVAMFLFGMSLLTLFLWYFATDSDQRKRVIGLTLTILLCALCVNGFWPVKQNKTDERLKYEGLTEEQVDELRADVQAYLTKNGFVRDADDERVVFPHNDEGSYNADTKLAFEKTYGDSGSAKIYVIDGTMGQVEGDVTANQFVNIFNFWEGKTDEQSRNILHGSQPAPAPDELSTIWSGIIDVCDPYDFAEPDWPLEKGIDLEGGSSFLVRIDSDENVTDKEIEQVISVLTRRLNAFGGKDLFIASQGSERIIVQMPGIDDEQRDSIRESLTKPSVLNFYLVDEARQSDAPRVADGEIVVPGMKLFEAQDPNDGVDGYFLLSSQPAMEGRYVTDGNAAPNAVNNWSVMVDYDSEGRNLFGDLTSKNKGKRLAIVLDDKVLSAPRINGPIYGTTEITGNFSEEEARSLASALENPMRNPLVIETESSVDPALGKEAINQGMFAAIAGLAVTLLFVVAYYRLAGLVALCGLFVNLIILMGAMAMFQFTLTLPGIAGIILTIGIAVDANVLIFERMKEELQENRSIQGAISGAYDKAFSAIVDANLTSLITAMILFAVTTGPVRGFAVTLMVGIIGSMFAAILVTRVIFSWGLSLGFLKKLSFWEFIPQKSLDFLGKRKMAFIISSGLIILTLIAVGVRQEKVLGVDFRGGHLFTLKADDESITTQKVDEVLQDYPLSETPITQSQVSTTDDSRYITIRMVEKKTAVGEADPSQVEEVKALLTERLGLDETTPIQNESVGSSIGRELAIWSVIAMILGMGGIFLYVVVRFELSFAVGVVVALIHDVVITFGLVILMGREMSLVLVGAFLTVAGYSVNDTIVVFDRIRERLKLSQAEVKVVINESISMTLRRTLLTSLTTLFTLVILFIFGGLALRDFALTMIVGILIGTYSSIFVAAPVVLWWTRRRKTTLRHEIQETEERILAASSKGGSAPVME